MYRLEKCKVLMVFFQDPTPSHDIKNVQELKKILVDASQPLFDRYKAMFTLRNINSDDAILALG